MSRNIRILEELTINKIAAGEVIEGPHSVVKELIENSIDAQSTNIEIEIKDGGCSYIRIKDNGVGIDEDDVELAFLRHATSKISSVGDLSLIYTLGFRGEALASIAAVSQVTLTSKPEGQDYGVSLEIHGGKVINNKRVGAPDGTSLIVRNIFFNVPARLEFLNSVRAEARSIGEIVSRLALSRPDIRFKYINNNNIMFTTPGNGDIKETIFAVFGAELVKSLIPLKSKTKGVTLNGYISQPTYFRSNRKYEIIFVNNRYIKNNLIYKAIEDAYEEKLPINKFPVCILNIDIEPKEIDVNVHPKKTEIKIYQREKIYNFMHNIILKTLSEGVIIPSIAISEPSYTNSETIQGERLIKDRSNYIAYNSGETFDMRASVRENSELSGNYKLNNKVGETQEKLLTNLLEDYKIIGQLFSTYIIMEKDDSMILIDQHAAHERIVYNLMLESLGKDKKASQRLLKPEIINLSNEDYDIIMQHLNRFNNLGFEVEVFGINTLIVREVPLLMGIPQDFKFFYEIIDELKEKKYNKSGQKGYDKINFKETIIRKSCSAAIRASDKLSISEMYKLIKDISKLDPPLTCPHGRPIILTLTRYEIEKNFKRIQ